MAARDGLLSPSAEGLVIPFEEIYSETDPAVCATMSRKWARLTLLAIDGLLLDFEGSVLEEDDLRLIQEVAWAADRWAQVAAQRREETAPPPPLPPGVTSLTRRRQLDGLGKEGA